MPAHKSSKEPKKCEVCHKVMKKCVCSKANGGKGPSVNKGKATGGQATKGAFDMGKIMEGKKGEKPQK